MFTRRKRYAVSLVLAVVLVAAPVAMAQQTAPTTDDWASLKNITAGSKLDVKLRSGKKVKGNLISVTDTALSLSDKNKTIDLNQADIQSVHLISGGSVKKSALIGAAIVGGAFAALGAAGNSNDPNDLGPHYSTPAIAAGAGVFGAGVGAAVGALIGKYGRKRTLIYQAKNA